MKRLGVPGGRSRAGLRRGNSRASLAPPSVLLDLVSFFSDFGLFVFWRRVRCESKVYNF